MRVQSVVLVAALISLLGCKPASVPTSAAALACANGEEARRAEEALEKECFARVAPTPRADGLLELRASPDRFRGDDACVRRALGAYVGPWWIYASVRRLLSTEPSAVLVGWPGVIPQVVTEPRSVTRRGEELIVELDPEVIDVGCVPAGKEPRSTRVREEVPEPPGGRAWIVLHKDADARVRLVHAEIAAESWCWIVDGMDDIAKLHDSVVPGETRAQLRTLAASIDWTASRLVVLASPVAPSEGIVQAKDGAPVGGGNHRIELSVIDGMASIRVPLSPAACTGVGPSFDTASPPPSGGPPRHPLAPWVLVPRNLSPVTMHAADMDVIPCA